MNLGKSNIYTRSLNWGGAGSENLGFDGDEATIWCSSSFLLNSPTVSQPDDVTLNELIFIESQDAARIYGDLILNRLVIQPGKTITLSSNNTITVNELVAVGESDAFISISGQTEGSQAIIHQESGTVEGQYLELKDLAATGGATFNANNSINNGNVSGWNFFGQPQSIDFPDIDDRLETAGSFTISASASSGLSVILEVVGGPATIDGDMVTLTGAGEVQIKASQPGNIEYTPAPSVIQSFCAIPLKPTITVGDMNPNLLTSSRAEGNQWFVDGEAIAGANAQTHIATVNGTYTVQTILGPCESEISDGVEVTTTSVFDLYENGRIALMPNPVVDALTIDLKTSLSGRLYITILDGSGRVRHTRTCDADITDQVRLDFSALPAGMYFVTGECESGVFRVPVVKM